MLVSSLEAIDDHRSCSISLVQPDLGTVDGSEIRLSPVEVGSLARYVQGVYTSQIHPRWLFGISSINGIIQKQGPF